MKKIFLFIIIFLTLTGCTKENNYTEEIIDTSNMSTTENTNISNDVVTNSSDTNTDNNINTESNDTKVINYFNSAKEEIKNYINTSNIDKVKEKGKEYFITMTDFLFYNGEIKGIYLSDISTGTKDILVNICGEIDEMIIKVSPGYKETLIEKYTILNNLAETGYNNTLVKIKETIT